MKDKTAGVAIKEIVGLKPKMYSLLVDDSSKYEKAQSVNKNAVETISHNEYRDVLFNNKCFRHSMNRINSKNERIRSFEMNKISLSFFDDKMNILNNGFVRLALVD